MTYADKIFFNGNIYTVNENAPHAEAIAVSGDRLLFVGSNEDVQQFKGPGTEMVDLKGKTVLPGIIDSHTHYH